MFSFGLRCRGDLGADREPSLFFSQGLIINIRRHHRLWERVPLELAVSIALNCLEYLLGQDIGIDIRRLGDRAGVGAGLMEALDRRAAAIVRSLK